MKIYKMKDNTDSYTIKKNKLFDLPKRLLLIGKSGNGKSSFLGNLLLRKDMYRNDFKPENIYIFSGSLYGDKKIETIIKELDIPEENLFDRYNDDEINIVYDMLVEDYNESIALKEKPEQKLILFDDLSYTNKMKTSKKESALDRLFCNGRKFLISTIVTAQKYSQLNTTSRENCTAMIINNCSNKQIELIEADVNFTKSKKYFMELFRELTKDKFSTFIVNFSNDTIYQDSNFENICICKDNSNKCKGKIIL